MTLILDPRLHLDGPKYQPDDCVSGLLEPIQGIR